EKLKELGCKSETYEDIIWRLIENKNEYIDFEAVQRVGNSKPLQPDFTTLLVKAWIRIPRNNCKY
ncbi:MAG: hypothetical protein WA421_09960, partial [Nitrososphaeraceae archaeon]